MTLPKVPKLTAEHKLKCWPELFSLTRIGIKGFDFRRRKKGRVFERGQFIMLEEWNPETKEYTGRWDVYNIDFVLFSEDVRPFGSEPIGGDIMSLTHLESS